MLIRSRVARDTVEKITEDGFYRLNPVCLALAPLAILIVCGYSYTKRFTSLSHLVLGLSLGLAPIGAWIAVTGRVALPAVLLGVAGVFHAITVCCLALLMPLVRLGPIYGIGLVLAGALLCYEHLLVHRHGLAKLDKAFFNLNGLLSLGMLLATLGDVLFAK